MKFYNKYPGHLTPWNFEEAYAYLTMCTQYNMAVSENNIWYTHPGLWMDMELIRIMAQVKYIDRYDEYGFDDPDVDEQ